MLRRYFKPPSPLIRSFSSGTRGLLKQQPSFNGHKSQYYETFGFFGVLALAGFGVGASLDQKNLFASVVDQEEEDHHYKDEEFTYVIIGTGLAAYEACKAIRERDTEGSILVIGPSEVDSIGLRRPMFWDREVEQKVEENFDITLVTDNQIAYIDVSKRALELSDKRLITYKSLLYASDGRTRVVRENEEILMGSIKDPNLPNDIKHFEGNQFHVIITGDSLPAIELATILSTKQTQVSLLLNGEGVLDNILPKYLADHFADRFDALDGVKVYRNVGIDSTNRLEPGTVSVALSEMVVKTDETTGKSYRAIEEGETLTGDFIVIGEERERGRRHFLQPFRLELDRENGGVVTNSELEAKNGLYVAGPDASYYDVKLRRRQRITHDLHAALTGRCAGYNMTGAHLDYSAITSTETLLPGASLTLVGDTDPFNHRTVAVWEADSNQLPAPSDEQSEEKPPILKPVEPTKDQHFKRGAVFYFDTVTSTVVGVAMFNLNKDLHMSKAKGLIRAERRVGRSVAYLIKKGIPFDVEEEATTADLKTSQVQN